MGKKLTVIIDDNLDERFREAVFKSKGMHRGNITEAIEEAIDLWINEKTKEKKQLAISIEDSKDEIRAFFRHERDKLTEKSAKLDLWAGSDNRQHIQTIVEIEAEIYSWLASLNEKIEKLFLTMHQLNVDFQQYEPIMKHFKEYLAKVEKEKEKFR